MSLFVLTGCGGGDAGTNYSGGGVGNPSMSTTDPTTVPTTEKNPDHPGNQGTQTPDDTESPTKSATTAPPTTTTAPVSTPPNLVVTKVWITNDDGVSTSCRLHVSVHNSSSFTATDVRVEYDVVGQEVPKFYVGGGRLLADSSIPAGRDETYGNYISYAVPSGDPLAVKVHVYAGGDEVYTATPPNFLYCNS